MKKEIKYLQYLLRHKWYVMIECFKSGIFLRGILHDISKFSPKEFFPYVNFFYGNDSFLNKGSESKHGYCKPTYTGDMQFDIAWSNHCKKNKHHWQAWIVEENGKTNILPMQEPYLTEMLCDWVGAGKAQGHFSPKDDPYFNVRNWYKENGKKLKLADETREKIEKRIRYIPKIAKASAIHLSTGKKLLLTK